MTLIYNTLPPTTDLPVNKQTLWINKPFLTLEKKQDRMKQNRKWEEKWKEKKKNQQSSTRTSLIFIHEIWHILTLNIGL